MPELSVIYVNWNTSQLLIKSINAIKNTIHDVDYEIWVVDNASTDDSVSSLCAHFPQVKLIQNKHNVGFARANNQAMQLAQGKYFLLINTDAFPSPQAIDQMVQVSEQQPKAGIIGACLLNPDGSFQASYVDFPSLHQEFLIISGLGRLIFGPWYPNHSKQSCTSARKVDYVQGACLFVRRSAYEEVGGLDEGYFMYSEEVDWCYQMHRAGWEVWYQPKALITHIGGASSQPQSILRETNLYISLVRYFRKNHNYLSSILMEAMLLSLASLKYIVHFFLRMINGRRFKRMAVSPMLLLNRVRELE